MFLKRCLGAKEKFKSLMMCSFARVVCVFVFELKCLEFCFVVICFVVKKVQCFLPCSNVKVLS
jgi:hypothetical protein